LISNHLFDSHVEEIRTLRFHPPLHFSFHLVSTSKVVSSDFILQCSEEVEIARHKVWAVWLKHSQQSVDLVIAFWDGQSIFLVLPQGSIVYIMLLQNTATIKGSHSEKKKSPGVQGQNDSSQWCHPDRMPCCATQSSSLRMSNLVCSNFDFFGHGKYMLSMKWAFHFSLQLLFEIFFAVISI
jgi:hypothetical protein